MKTSRQQKRIGLVTAISLILPLSGHCFFHTVHQDTTKSNPDRASAAVGKVGALRFSTKYQDTETDLSYLGYRYYNPSGGRWLSRDPVEEKGGINVFCFVQNAPTFHIDPDGQKCCCCCAQWVSVEDVRQLLFPYAGHVFSVKLGMHYPENSGTLGSCAFKFKEKTDDSPQDYPSPVNRWYDVIGDYPFSDQARVWRARNEPCGGTETVSIPDVPRISLLRHGGSYRRRTQWKFELFSTPGCWCANKMIAVEAEQVIALSNGWPDPNATYFKITKQYGE